MNKNISIYGVFLSVFGFCFFSIAAYIVVGWLAILVGPVIFLLAARPPCLYRQWLWEKTNVVTFLVCVELPKNHGEPFGAIVPLLGLYGIGCYATGDTWVDLMDNVEKSILEFKGDCILKSTDIQNQDVLVNSEEYKDFKNRDQVRINFA